MTLFQPSLFATSPRLCTARNEDIAGQGPGLGDGHFNSTLARRSTRTSHSGMKTPHQNDRGWRRVVRNFSLSWFNVTMGTGVVAMLLHEFPWKARWLYWLSVVVFGVNVLLFLLGFVVSLLRYTLWPELWTAMLQHPSQSQFVGAVPMSLSTIVNMTVFVCVPAWGEWVMYAAWGLWIVDAVLSLTSAIYIPFQLIKQPNDLHLRVFTALPLFPVISTVVAAASAGVIAGVLPHPQQGLATVIAGYVLWGVGVPTSLVILVIYFHRLLVHKLPPREDIVSSFLPLGPLNMGAFGLMQLGDVARRVFPETHTIDPLAGSFLYSIGAFVGLIMWSFALLWLFFAVASIHQTKRFPFNMGWWAFTFPMGTFALSSGKLASQVPSRFFRVIAAIASVCVFLLWLIVAAATIRAVVIDAGKSMDAPSLKDLESNNRSDESRDQDKAAKQG